MRTLTTLILACSLTGTAHASKSYDSSYGDDSDYGDYGDYSDDEDCPVGYDYADTEYGPGCVDDTGLFQTCPLGWWFDADTDSCTDAPAPAILERSADGTYRVRAGDCEFWLDIGQLYAREDAKYSTTRYNVDGDGSQSKGYDKTGFDSESAVGGWTHTRLRKRSMLGTQASDVTNLKIFKKSTPGRQTRATSQELDSWAQSYTTVDMGVGVSGPRCDIKAVTNAHITGGVLGVASAGADYAAATWAAADAWGIGHGMALRADPEYAGVSDVDDTVTIQVPVGKIPVVGGILKAFGLTSLDIDFANDSDAYFGGAHPMKESGKMSQVTQWDLHMLSIAGVRAKVAGDGKTGSRYAKALTRAAAHHTMSLTATCVNQDDYKAPGCEAVLTMPTKDWAELEVTHPDGTQTKACFQAPANTLRVSEDKGFQTLEESWHAVACKEKQPKKTK